MNRIEDKKKEIEGSELTLEELSVEIEKEHQKFLMYRIYDINDMISVLKPLCQ